ncbi:MAG: M20/M25/M40 family metallo-hydrolase [Deltaproteobacteria bacterium]|nr:M20/M25/M40 family metallo-hydrolase [Deltaproteobacteria bacterium]
MAERSLELLRDYVSIPSVNPMGRDDLPAAITGERRYAEHLAAQLRRLHLDAAVIGTGERASVVAEARPAGARGAPLLVASHLDTVPVDGMEIAPFDPHLAAGRLYGRGACDTKGGMAALVAALERVLARGTLRRPLVVVGEADEEFGSAGVHDVLAHLGAARPAWALATEPTGLRVVTHHKGIAELRLEAHGRAGHSSAPEAGRNAIYALARAALALAGLAERLAARRDPALGPATLSVGRVGGGHAFNVVPDHAWLVADRRLLPGEDATNVRREVEAVLRDAGLADDVALTHLEARKPALATDPAAPCVRACRAALAAAGCDAPPAAAGFATDAGVFAARGIPAVVLGPGSIEQAHTAREWVALDQVAAMEELFARLLETPAA